MDRLPLDRPGSGRGRSDLARGFMLLFIALANSHYFVQGATILGGFPQDGSGLDRGFILLIATFVDGRAFPLFGQRSPTCYLIQYLFWMVAFTPYLAGLSDDLTVTTTALLATATWLVTVWLAYWMHLRSYRGPLETLVRRFTYGRSSGSISAV